MSGINSVQDQELTFLTGVTGQGLLAAQSFWTWNEDLPATYSSTESLQAKWGAPQAGTGGTINVAFDAASNWTATEQTAFIASMDLWSAEANVRFNLVPQAQAPDLVITRTSDGKAQGGMDLLDTGTIGSTLLGKALKASISIDTSVGGFGPIGADFYVAGGYPWSTVLHELGHAIGLGHGGAYDSGTTTNSPMYTAYDNTAWTIMAYTDGPQASSDYIWGSSGGYARAPVTPMLLDIAAAQRIYGPPTDTPLSGGQVFGFNTNIQGDIARFFDFSLNTRPVVTLFDTGSGNSLDLSGYSLGSTVDLHDGTFSSVAGLKNNIAIAFGTRIDRGIGGSGSDAFVGNDNGDVLMGGAGADTLAGGTGNDHIYGNLSTSIQGMTDGADLIDAGDGSNYVNGNAGNDVITAGWGTNRLYGGGGDDQIRVTGGGSSHLNGNLGDDLLQVAGGANDIHGGQGNDTIMASAGNNYSFGEVGNDVIRAGTGIDVMAGGIGADLFVLGAANSSFNWDEITDFTDGTDLLHVDTTNGLLPTIVHAGQAFSTEASAAAYANGVLAGVSDEAAALQVGADSYLFYTINGSGSVAAVRLDNVTAAIIDQYDFTIGTNHL